MAWRPLPDGPRRWVRLWLSAPRFPPSYTAWGASWLKASSTRRLGGDSSPVRVGRSPKRAQLWGVLGSGGGRELLYSKPFFAALGHTSLCARLHRHPRRAAGSRDRHQKQPCPRLGCSHREAKWAGALVAQQLGESTSFSRAKCNELKHASVCPLCKHLISYTAPSWA